MSTATHIGAKDGLHALVLLARNAVHLTAGVPTLPGASQPRLIERRNRAR